MQRGATLIELLVVLVIIMLLAGLYLGLKGNSGPGKPKTLPGKAIDKAVGSTCQSNIRQLRMNIQMDTMSDEPPPATLSEAAKGLGAEFTGCPSSGQPYVYDPKTRTVYCPTPGHEKF